jgi:mannose-6-phosphate isomerase-like protein (cupin superfamily)
METLRSITVPASGTVAVDREQGPEMFLVLSGQGQVRFDGGSPASLGRSQAVLAQQGASVQVSNLGGEDLKLLSFRVVSSGGSP